MRQPGLNDGRSLRIIHSFDRDRSRIRQNNSASAVHRHLTGEIQLSPDRDLQSIARRYRVFEAYRSSVYRSECGWNVLEETGPKNGKHFADGACDIKLKLGRRLFFDVDALIRRRDAARS